MCNLVTYHLYQQLKADEHKAYLTMTMPQFNERWNIESDIEIFSFYYLLQAIIIFIAFPFIVSNFVHVLKIMWLSVNGKQYDDAYVLIETIQIIAL